MPPKKKPPDDDASVYRVGLLGASKKTAYVEALSVARDEAAGVAFHTYNVLKVYVAKYGITFRGTGDAFPTDVINLVQNSFFKRRKSEYGMSEKMQSAFDEYVAAVPTAVSGRKKLSGMAGVLNYQATTIHTAVSNSLTYGTYVRQVTYLQGKYGIRRPHAKIAASRIGASKAQRSEKAADVLIGRAQRAETSAFFRHANAPTAASFTALSNAKAALKRTREEAPRIADAAACAVLDSENRFPRRWKAELKQLVEEVVRRERLLVPESGGQSDQLGYACRMLSEIPVEEGVRRFSIIPSAKMAPSFIRIDKGNLYALLGEKKPDDDSAWLTVFFDEKKLRRFLTGKTTLGRSALTDGVQLQVSVVTRARFGEDEEKFRKMAEAKEAGRKRKREEMFGEITHAAPPTETARAASGAKRAANVYKPKAQRMAEAMAKARVHSWRNVVAVDPGHSNVFTTAVPAPFAAEWDVCDPKARFAFQTLSLGQYYHDTGARPRQLQLERWKKWRPEIVQLETNLPSSPELGSEVLVAALARRASARTALYEFYGQKKMLRQRFKAAICKAKVVAREVKRICPTRDTIVAFGDAKFACTRKGLRASACGVIKKELVRIAGSRVVEVDEYLTSRLCSCCRCRMEHSVRRFDPETGRHGGHVHGLYQCTNTRDSATRCGISWNRDENAAINIWRVFHSLKTRGSVPEEFCR